jgi:hypothetical protein
VRCMQFILKKAVPTSQTHRHTHTKMTLRLYYEDQPDNCGVSNDNEFREYTAWTNAAGTWVA